ncbi:PEP-CTERM sorting domain-containing protein [Verrucomicrobiaceae bacterium R5-34]|uniref:PEP-CTERM sorting domain-containing protein n=1 Tax=Oceaniferula flava TaxID=2800421 RepID=A0AAE2SEF8_9BACT|nr:PEP-CTERM sorting domain-containing protein [Oceaniferula flavus]MBK1830205.1 PEP-CTERM sorting domain-containing protein [Verrucomicrobiaceae bacterium R5-34]MBK1854796.1 PEP-CTERM sorting domain-containing protein [Oceaniferula flavus]MBM1136102.1 PEP-CTERM sorting domain-containing protein [Oceaniferula flavus]
MTRHKKTLSFLAGTAILTACAIPSVSAATTIINATLEGRAIDNTNVTGGVKGNGSGNAFNSGAAQAGAYNSGVDLVGVISFQMTGVDPTDIVSADFSSLQNTVNLSDTSLFSISANVIRIDASSAGQNSDFEAAPLTTLMTGFDGNATTDTTASLDAAGQIILGDWLKSNWVEGEYVFIQLKADNTDMQTGSNNLYNYSNSTLTITTVPEPSSAALLGLGGLALIMRRRK